MLDLLVVGAGPSGAALAHAAARQGLATALLDPRPEKVWTRTYALWADEIPEDLPLAAIATCSRQARIIARREHVLDRGYAVLDNVALWRHLRRPAVTVLTGRAREVTHDTRGATVSGSGFDPVRARIVVDATGACRALCGGRRRHPTIQSAHGVILPATEVTSVAAVDHPLVMDWRPVDRGAPPSFLYAVPVSADRMLLEETCLAARPGLSPAVLRARLVRRLSAHGVSIERSSAIERVWFPVDDPPERGGSVLGYGSGFGLTHPATGFGVADSLRWAGPVAAALAGADDPGEAVRRARRVLWSRSARVTRWLRRRGLAAISAPALSDTRALFEAFCGLATAEQRSYTSQRDSVIGISRAMYDLISEAPTGLKPRLAFASFGPSGGRFDPYFGRKHH
jgi:lycopene beta-cyclase